MYSSYILRFFSFVHFCNIALTLYNLCSMFCFRFLSNFPYLRPFAHPVCSLDGPPSRQSHEVARWVSWFFLGSALNYFVGEFGGFRFFFSCTEVLSILGYAWYRRNDRWKHWITVYVVCSAGFIKKQFNFWMQQRCYQFYRFWISFVLAFFTVFKTVFNRQNIILHYLQDLARFFQGIQGNCIIPQDLAIFLFGKHFYEPKFPHNFSCEKSFEQLIVTNYCLVRRKSPPPLRISPPSV